jgi:IS30 family transposase
MRSTIPNLVSIHDRPKAVDKRKEFGNWEGDLIIYGITNPRNVTTLVERKTRFTKLIVNSSKRSIEVISGIKKAFAGDSDALRSITFDRGKEFTYHSEISAKTFFCDPASPWQKGTVENTNGRIRHIMPARTTPRLFRQEHLDRVQKILNNTPRKILGYKTPEEAFYANLNNKPHNRCNRI